MRMPRIIIIPILIVLALAGACKREPAATAIDEMNAQQLAQAARRAAERAQSMSGYKAKSKQKDWAIKGKAYARRCIGIAPDEAECYYWRAVNTGLYHQVKVRGYQKGIKQMISDCETAIRLGKGSYDHGGPYRIPGEIYTKLPETGGRPDSTVRDLDKALELLKRAVAIAPDYPENRIALAETLYKMDRFDEALNELVLAKREARKWRSDISYRDWQKTIKSLTRKIERKK
jgi:tetratricopeptide (TPR) repeat protein